MLRLLLTRAAGFLAAALLLLPAPSAAQAVVDSGAFVVRLGTDTVALERWVRTADRLDAVSVTRTPRTVVRRYSVRLDAAGRVTHATIGDAAERAVEAIPLAGGFYAPYALAVTQASRSGSAETVVSLLVGSTARDFTVRRAAAGEFVIPNQFEQPMQVRTGANHRVVSIDIGGGSTVERVAWFDIDARAREFAARDERGTGLGPLSPRDTAAASVAGARILVDYSRPSARGRTVMGGLVPWGELWRTGANDATQLITDRPLQFGDVRLDPGSYSVFTVPGEQAWQLIFNRRTDISGLERDPAQDVGQVTMQVHPLPSHVEQLTITVEPAGSGGELRIQWGTAAAAARFIVVDGQTQSPQARSGRLVIAGGGVSRDNADLYRAVLDGRLDDGPICVIPTASAGLDGARSSMNSSVATFQQHGGAGAAVGILMSNENAETAGDPAVVQQIRSCGGFYFTGGVQSRTVAVFRPDGRNAPALDAILARYRAGAVVGGSSAGAAIMSDPMIAGGSTTTALNGVRRAREGASDDTDATDSAGGISVAAGIGFLESAIVDQHFLARGRIGRLITAVLDLEEFDLGFGVDENTAIIIDGDAAFVAGESGVIIVDAREARRDGRGATDVRLHLMSSGDRFDIATGRLAQAADKQPLQPSTAAVTAPEDLFARWQLLHLLVEFGRSADAHLAVPVQGGELVLRKAADFTALSRTGAGVQDTPAALSISGLRLDVQRGDPPR
ncbi:hypothetical protein BH23GEM9_BH23GEM9_16360 [soil metagenome]